MKIMKINTNRNKTYINCLHRNKIKMLIKLKCGFGVYINYIKSIDIDNLLYQLNDTRTCARYLVGNEIMKINCYIPYIVFSVFRGMQTKYIL